MKNSVYLIYLIFFIFSCSKDKITPPTSPPPPTPVIPTYPQFNLIFDGEIPVDHKIEMTFEIEEDSVLIQYPGKIERRGGISIAYDKHSYEIDFEEDIPLTDLSEDDDWILNANYIDKTFMRHTISYDLFREMNNENVSPNYQYIELALNGNYEGLYVLMEKMDRSTLMINKNDTSAVIFKDPPIFRESDQFTPQDPNNYHQQSFPKIEELDKSFFIEGVRDFIKNSDDNIFSENISQIFDIENIVDWNLLLLMTNNGDGILKNFFLYKSDVNTPIKIAPWDYDHSFGRDGDNELNLVNPIDINRSILFKRLLTLDWYKTKLKNRWAELNAQNLLSVEGLKDRISKMKSIVETGVYKNFSIWSWDSVWYYDDNNFEAEIEIMNQFIDIRHSQVVDFLEGL